MGPRREEVPAIEAILNHLFTTTPRAVCIQVAEIAVLVRPRPFRLPPTTAESKIHHDVWHPVRPQIDSIGLVANGGVFRDKGGQSLLEILLRSAATERPEAIAAMEHIDRDAAASGRPMVIWSSPNARCPPLDRGFDKGSISVPKGSQKRSRWPIVLFVFNQLHGQGSLSRR